MRGLHLMVKDIVAAREELLDRGVLVEEIVDVGADGVMREGVHPETDYNSFALRGYLR